MRNLYWLPKLWGYRPKKWAMKYFDKWREFGSTSGMKAIVDLPAFMEEADP